MAVLQNDGANLHVQLKHFCNFATGYPLRWQNVSGERQCKELKNEILGSKSTRMTELTFPAATPLPPHFKRSTNELGRRRADQWESGRDAADAANSCCGGKGI